ncbi:GNAT family N-acetyltransferase [Psychromicrobium sp. YIM B11713]|uniref:GNAT family N-acetyltransferase n=1 Tax=Psychromicrobium sp. YIM B11713 TaxID=3145233 RepID=UPI00374FC897
MVEFRRAVLVDRDALVELAALSFPHSAPPGTDPVNLQHHIDQQLNAEKFAWYLCHPEVTVLVAEEDGALLGYSVTVAAPSQDSEVVAALSLTPAVELSKFFVHPERFGAGIAAGLMKTTLQEAAGSGAQGIWLGVSSVNERAIRFYQKNGFSRVGMKSFLFGTVLERDFVMQRSLP